MRFSLRWLLIAVLFIAISVAALLKANVYWAGGVPSTLYLLLSLAVVFALLARGNSRAFWLGFAVVGWIQFASVRFADFKYDSDPEYKYLATDQAIEWLHARVVRDVEIEVQVYRGGVPLEKRPQIVKRPNIDYFRVVGRCAIVALTALIGGYVAMWFHSRRERLRIAASKLAAREHGMRDT